jgi:MoaA/NifB/PqqE/SkfB family radical SAM enzyme
MTLTDREARIRTSLQERKPRAFEKIQNFPEKIKNHESIALLQLQYKYACNFKCKHCAIEKFKQAGGKTLTLDEVKSIADQSDKIGLASICISGGEPLIFKDLKEVVDNIGPSRFNISLDTNGWFLSKEKIKWLVDIGVDRIHLSIDGLEQNHSMFRGEKDSWKKCIQALDWCKLYGLGVIINIVITKDLIKSGELINQLEYIKQFNQHASMIYAKPTGSFEEHKDQVLDTKDIEYVQSLTSKYNCSTHLSPNCGHEFGCLCFKRHFSITAYGDVLACPWIPISFGNIREESLQDIINRGLKMKWFSYDNKYSCQSGNTDTFFYQKILSQVNDNKQYPVSWKDINWYD